MLLLPPEVSLKFKDVELLLSAPYQRSSLQLIAFDWKEKTVDSPSIAFYLLLNCCESAF